MLLCVVPMRFNEAAALIKVDGACPIVFGFGEDGVELVLFGDYDEVIG